MRRVPSLRHLLKASTCPLRTRLSFTTGVLNSWWMVKASNLVNNETTEELAASNIERLANTRQIPPLIQVNAVENYVGEMGLPIFSSGYVFSTRAQDLCLSCRAFLHDTDTFQTFCTVVFIFIYIYIICSFSSFLNLLTQLFYPVLIIFNPK